MTYPKFLRFSLISTLLICVFVLAGCRSKTGIVNDGNLVDRVTFAPIDTAQGLLTREDDFTENWSKFDIDSRLQKSNGDKTELLTLAAQQARDWSPSEKQNLTAILQGVEQKIADQGFDLSFPDEVFFVKTTANEEGGAGGYTRANYVVLGQAQLTQDKSEIERLVIHELFHILSRHDPVLRKAMYKTIGFELINDVDYPASLKALRITNPDAVKSDHMIRLAVNGEPVDAMMVLYASKDYAGGSFFDYLNIGFMQLDDTSPRQAKFVEGQPIIHGFNDVTGFAEKIGGNTEYIIHPEEIIAENFVDTILGTANMPSPEIIDNIALTLKGR